MKGSITPVIPKSETIWFEYNPPQFESSKEVNWAEINVPGLDFPLQQFVSGGLNKLSIALYFNADDYDQAFDVKQAVNSLEALIEKSDETLAPPVCLFSWGAFQFPCLIGSVNARYTMFDRDGHALEATVDLSLRAYKEKKTDWTPPKALIKERRQKKPVFYGKQGSNSVFAKEDEGTGNDAKTMSDEGMTIEHELKAGESLQDIAVKYYGSPNFWRLIAFANQGDNTKALKPGVKINLPDPDLAVDIMERITNFPSDTLERLTLEKRRIMNSIKPSLGVMRR